jgi:holin-like protein
VHCSKGAFTATETRNTVLPPAEVSGVREDNAPCARVASAGDIAHATETAAEAPVVTRTTRALGVTVQLVLLVALSQLAELAVRAMHLPVPSNAVGMLMLFLLLHHGILRLGQIDAAAALFVRHLAFFFIPIAVGLMAYRELLATTGTELLIVIAASALIGMLAAGLVVQLVKRVRP